MAWTSPRTYQTGDLINAAMLNEQLKDNLNELSTHVHDGSAGEGNDELAGVDSITFDDVDSTPDAPASGKIIIYSESGVLKYRVPAGTVFTLSTTSHTHQENNMAWNNPVTWADGNIPDEDDLNQQIRDNMNALSTHTHSGAAGDGSATLSGVDSITTDDAGSTPSAAGSNKVIIFSEGGLLKMRAGASGSALTFSIAFSYVLIGFLTLSTVK